MGKNAYLNESGLPKSTKNKLFLWMGSTLIVAIFLAMMGFRADEIIVGAVIWATLSGVVTLVAIIDDTLTNRRNKSK